MKARPNVCWLTVAVASAIVGFIAPRTGAAADQPAIFTVTLKVVDARKMPVPKADVALFWDIKDGAMTARAKTGGITDETGKAVLVVDDWHEKRPVLVLTADRTLGGIVGVSKADDGKEVIATLASTVRVKGKLECPELNTKLAWANTTVTADGFRAFVAQNISTSAVFQFVLPAGKYVLESYGTDVENAKQTVILTTDRAEYNLGAVDLKATAIPKLRGKTPPDWSITDARGVNRSVKLSDYKGKWVYVEFWGFW
ncbi:MAG: hypothetical protein ACYDH9_22400 [Limisphaerales bacterium]